MMHDLKGGRTRRNVTAPKKKAGLPPSAKAFEEFAWVMEAAQHMIWARKSAQDNGRHQKMADCWTGFFHKSFELSEERVFFVKRCRQAKLSKMEIEIVAALLLSHYSMVEDNDPQSCSDLFQMLSVTGAQAIQVHKGLSGKGPLYELGILIPADPDDSPDDRRIQLDPIFAQDVLHDRDSSIEGWGISSEADLFDNLSRLNDAMESAGEIVANARRHHAKHASINPIRRRIVWLWTGLNQTLALNPTWKLGAFLSQERSLRIYEQRILILLIGRELGQLDNVESVCTAAGLLRCAGAPPDIHEEPEGIFRPESKLVRLGLIQPCDGVGSLIGSSNEELSEIQFELTQGSLDILDIKRRTGRKMRDAANLRQGRLNLKDLVLSTSVRDSVYMALSQVRYRTVLMDNWGLAKMFPYGRGVTVLLSGPPGTGKTAISEAIAKELGKPLLVADYSQIQNCYVGQTEKNVARTFFQARQHGAVLFWDEADAMFFDRDTASHNWEVRDINVLLQELEKFDGVCILATNRKITLDKAVERRISLKIELGRPDRNMRQTLWTRLLPATLPLSSDVQVNKLAETDLSGGEIKNVILNAARLALCRNPFGQLTMVDFERSVALELNGMWSESSKNRAGFAPNRLEIMQNQPTTFS